jgi:hypothetical protein
MTEATRTLTAKAAKFLFAGAMIAGGALAMAGQAAADPADPAAPVTPIPGAPDAPPAPEAQAVQGGDAPMAAPPVGAPMVPEIQNPQYGSGSGPLGFLRDAWHQAKDPYGVGDDGPDGMPVGAAPPPGAGPPPPLPPGFHSLNFPESDAPVTQAPPNSGGGPALPPGYYPLNGPPPPGYNPPAPADPSAPATVLPAPPG